MAVQRKQIVVVKGPSAHSQTFEFRVAPAVEGQPKSGKLVVGKDPVTIKLDSAEAKKIDLQGNLERLIARGYLSEIGGKQPQKESAE